MLARALVRSLFRIVESPWKNDRWVYARIKTQTQRVDIQRATLGGTAGAIGGEICGSIPPVVVALEMGLD
jgi:hypothetical protein